jgi:hypothetical protein
MTVTVADEIQRTSPLALWRYAHEYLCVARNLCDQVRIKSIESQAPYHVAAQGIEFALKAYLRARGASMTELQREVGHSLSHALDRSEALGMPAVPVPWRTAIDEMAPFHQDGQFVYLTVTETTFPEITPLVDAGVWILYRIAPDVVDHFAQNLGTDTTPPAPEFVRRLRAALSATSEIAHPAVGQVHDTARTYGDELSSDPDSRHEPPRTA